MTNEHTETKPNKIEVLVATTSGTFPPSGFDDVAINQPVHVQLAKAARALHIVDVSTWIARVNGREIDPAKSYAENHLTGRITIDYGPREGGGGSEQGR